MIKMTFTLDEATVGHLRRSAARLAKPRSAVVRLAIRDYAERIGRLGEDERVQLLRAFDELVPRIPARAASAVEREIKAVRAARRRGGRAGSTRR